MEGAYRKAYADGTLADAIGRVSKALRACRLCPRNCGVDRYAQAAGVCKTGRVASVASFGPHFGEEAPLVGWGGSGTIFFSSCNLLCVFCQNADISHGRAGRPVSADHLAQMMLSLQRRGCHNINFVSPSHVIAQILKALPAAVEGGLTVPLVYNTGGYDTAETLAELNGIIDIYMPDLKITDADVAGRLCDAPDYPSVVRDAIREMHRQVGDLVVDAQGLARRGLLIRHLVMPNDYAGTRQAMRFAASLSKDTYVNIMGQYRPWHRSDKEPGIDRRPCTDEIERARAIAREEGLIRLD